MHKRYSTVFELRARPDVFGPRTDADYQLLSLQSRWVEWMREYSSEMLQKIPDETLLQYVLSFTLSLFSVY